MDLIVFQTKRLAVGGICLMLCAAVVEANEKEGGVVPVSAGKNYLEGNPPIDEAHPLYKLLKVAYSARKKLDEINDYQCVFQKREIVKTKLIKSTMFLKFREAPFSVYLKCQDLNQGREVIYVHGQNKNGLLVHEAGIKAIAGTFNINPTGPDALAENRYPITSIGLKTMIDTTIAQWEAEGKFEGIKVQKRPGSKLPLSGEPCTVYEAIHERFKQFKYHTTRIYIDDKTGIAVGAQQYAFPGTEKDIVEEYFYTQLKFNNKLTALDFDPKNPNYAYK